jgi:hypothetical protein
MTGPAELLGVSAEIADVLQAAKRWPSAGVQLRRALVTAQSVTTDSVTVQLSGDTTVDIPGVPVLAGTSIPKVGDDAWVLKSGADMVVLGTASYGAHGTPGRVLDGKYLSASSQAALTVSSTARVLLPGYTLAADVVANRFYLLTIRGGHSANGAAAVAYVTVKTGVTVSDGTDLALVELEPSANTNSRVPWRDTFAWKATTTGTVNFCAAAARLTASAFTWAVGSYGANDAGLFMIQELGGPADLA